MAEITLETRTGRVAGSSASRRLRREGRIPATVYGRGVESTSVSVDGRELRLALSGDAGVNQLLSLHVDGQSHLALARELQRHPVRHTVVHVDFQVVRRDQVVASDVPITLVGEAKAVEMEKGLVEQPLTTLTVHSVPSKIPNAIEVDVSGLSIGDTVRVGDLTLPDGVTTDVDPEEAVVVAEVSAVTAEVVEAEAAEAAEAEAAEAEAEAAGGEEQAAGEATSEEG